MTLYVSCIYFPVFRCGWVGNFQKSLSQQLACLVLCRTECVASETAVTCALQSVVVPSFTFKSDDVTPRAVVFQKG